MTIRVFIASSTEGLRWAKAVKKGLAEYDCTVWNEDVFKLSEYTLQSLETALHGNDYGVFVVGPDDKLTSRGHTSPAARDNVILELGMFIGRLNIKHSFVVQPDDMDLHLPSDLNGLTTAIYSSNRYRYPSKQVEAACTEIKNAIESAEQDNDPMRRVNEETLAYINAHGAGSFTQKRLLDSPYSVTQHLLDITAHGDWYTSFQRTVVLAPPQGREPGVQRTTDDATRVTSSGVYQESMGFESAQDANSYKYTKLLIDGEDVTKAWNLSHRFYRRPETRTTPYSVHFEIPWESGKEHRIHAEYESRLENPVLVRSMWTSPLPAKRVVFNVGLNTDSPSALEWTLILFPPGHFQQDDKNIPSINEQTHVSVTLEDWVLPGTCISWIAYHGSPSDHSADPED